jgi:hypothetical protein
LNSRAHMLTLARVVVMLGVASVGFIRGADHGPIYLGVVEPTYEDHAVVTPQTPFLVRVAFVSVRGGWRALPSHVSAFQELKDVITRFPEQVSWTIAHDGREEGEFVATRPPQWKFYADIGLFGPSPSTHVSLIRQGARDFTYWGADYPLPFRPLVVVSKPNVLDPDHWRPAPPPQAVIERVSPTFRKDVVTQGLVCDGKASLQYSERMIHTGKSFVSASGVRLVELTLDKAAVPQCNQPLGEAFFPRWYYVDHKTVRLIGQSLQWIDAGDYDQDGHSEIVLHKTGYNYDGYVLLYDKLERQVTFAWNYH